ncbi:MAG: type II toxin-antitoxin system RelB/DinJ family antitoxin [Oscillospiraceae bacterium]|nr:type II toxin-antitoxin system RelB/DinJ family antitoxin [Oscillospiraceae bacterium]
MALGRNATLSIEVDSKLTRDVKKIYSRYGIDLDEAIKIFLHESRNVGGLPFDLRFDEREPSDDTIEAIEEAERLINELKYEDSSDG